MKHVAIYARTSREYKGVERISIPQQVDDGQRLADKKIPVERIFIDADWSGKIPPTQFADGAKKTRPALSRLLAGVARGEINLIICRKRDRLFRSTLLALRFYDFLAKQNCGLQCTNENLPSGNDASGKFTLTVLAAAAQLELEKTSENIKGAKAYSRRQGLKMGPVWTPGYKDGERGRVEINSKGAEMVAELFERAAKGEPVQSLTRWLNDNHRSICRPKLLKSATWHPVSVWRMLSNRRYIGLNDDGSTSKIYTPIISPAVFWSVQEILKARKGSLNGGKRQKHERPLAGLLYCGICGKLLHTVSMTKEDKGSKLYACPFTRTIEHRENPFVMREDRWLQGLNELFVNGMAVAPESDETALLRTQLDAIGERTDELAKVFASGKLTATAFQAATTALDSERARLTKQIKNVTPKPQPLPRKTINPFLPLPGTFEAASPIEKKLWLRRCIDRVDVFANYALVSRPKQKPVKCPLMKQAVPAKRPSNCLVSPMTPRDITSIYLDLNLRNGAINWKPFIRDDFYPAAEMEKRLVSRRARKRHGLKGGRIYPGKKRKQ